MTDEQEKKILTALSSLAVEVVKLNETLEKFKVPAIPKMELLDTMKYEPPKQEMIFNAAIELVGQRLTTTSASIDEYDLSKYVAAAHEVYEQAQKIK